MLDLREVTSFADFFVICSGSNPKQIQAISEEIGLELEKLGEYPVSVEGFANAEWILADFGDYLIHVFSPKARAFYELERLWRHAKVVRSRARARRIGAPFKTPAPSPWCSNWNRSSAPSAPVFR